MEPVIKPAVELEGEDLEKENSEEEDLEVEDPEEEVCADAENGPGEGYECETVEIGK